VNVSLVPFWVPGRLTLVKLLVYGVTVVVIRPIELPP
jgi:hypothetical protein